MLKIALEWRSISTNGAHIAYLSEQGKPVRCSVCSHREHSKQGSRSPSERDEHSKRDPTLYVSLEEDALVARIQPNQLLLLL